jgi:glycosyltransferase involved in cell wall biosynthesis
MLTVAHLTASPFYGGPERQMVGLGHHLRPDVRTIFLSFPEGGNSQAFVDEARRQGFEALVLLHDTPNFRTAIAEVAEVLQRFSIDILLCHGYKAGILGRPAARRVRIPAVAVSRGWTYESLRIRAYELLDRINLRWMDRVVCVSQGQAVKVQRAGIPARNIDVIPNAIHAERFALPDPSSRVELEALFHCRIRHIVGAAGRLSPEKGFDILVTAAAQVVQSAPDVGFVIFGEGVLRPALVKQIAAKGLLARFVLAGFRPDLDRFLPNLDLLVQSSYTEGMPNVVLEASAAGVPVVATAVGGTPEIVEDGVTGILVPAGDPGALSGAIMRVLADEAKRRKMADLARQNALERFRFAAQAERYRDLFNGLMGLEHDSRGYDSAVEKACSRT